MKVDLLNIRNILKQSLEYQSMIHVPFAKCTCAFLYPIKMFMLHGMSTHIAQHSEDNVKQWYSSCMNINIV